MVVIGMWQGLSWIVVETLPPSLITIIIDLVNIETHVFESKSESAVTTKDSKDTAQKDVKFTLEDDVLLNGGI